MGLLDIIKEDIEDITTDTDGFGVVFKFEKADGTFVEVTGTTARHNTGFDTDGVMVNSKQVHVSLSEKTLTDAGIVVRNSGTLVDLIGRLVKVAHSTGAERLYKVTEHFPDETVGLIVFLLVICREELTDGTDDDATKPPTTTPAPPIGNGNAGESPDKAM